MLNILIPYIYLQLQEDELRGAVLLVLANKQDLPNAMNVSEITDKLNLSQLNNRQVCFLNLVIYLQYMYIEL